MTTTVPIVDAEGALRDWVAAQATLVGDGNPLTAGIQMIVMRGNQQATYALAERIGGPVDFYAGMDTARLSLTVYGPSKQKAFDAAKALTNALWLVPSGTPMGTTAVCLGVTIDSAPYWQPDPGSQGARYGIEITLNLRAA